MVNVTVQYAQLTEENLKALFKEVSAYLLESLPVVYAASTGPGAADEGLLGVLHRAVLLRQCDNLIAILGLIRFDLGHVTGALLRAACEELIWIKYLRSIEPKDAEELITYIYLTNTSDHIFKMYSVLGEEVMQKLCFPKGFEGGWRKTKESVLQKLKKLGIKLGWKKVDGRTHLPKMSILAKATGNEVYDLLYHIASVFVHFKVTELFRRTNWWDQEGVVSAASKKFHLSWSISSLYWGWRIYHQILDEFVKGDKEKGFIILHDFIEKEGREVFQWLDRYNEIISKHAVGLPLHVEELLTSKEDAETYNKLLENGLLEEMMKSGITPIIIVPPRGTKQSK